MSMNFGSVNAGDIAFVGCATASAVTHAVLSSAGTSYTQIGPTTANGNLNLSVWTRLLTVNDTTVTASGTGAAQDGDSSVVVVVRGAPFGTIKTSSAGSGSSANPNSPAVTIGSTSSIVLSIAAQLAANTVTALPAGYSSAFNVSASDTRSTLLAISTVIGSEQTSEDPGAYTFSGSAVWVAFTVAAISSGSVYFPMPDQWRDPPDYMAQPEMVASGLDRVHSSATGLR